MASVVQQCVLTPPLPDLSSLKSNNNNNNNNNNNVFEEGVDHNGRSRSSGSGGSRDPLLEAQQTPTSSSDRASERGNNDDPVSLLSRPVEGFHHPRQHVFTDRLIGRFYEDTSLDAETRRSSKCLAGRLGTAGSNATTTRPSTTAGSGAVPRPHSRSTHSARCGKRMLGSSASAHSLGISKGGAARPQVGARGVGGLSGRKEQVQKEIMEQKALIEKLEGKMASLSSRGGGRGSKSDGLVHAAGDARQSTAQDAGDSLGDVGSNAPDVTTQSPECVGRASRGEGILVDSEYYCSDGKAAEHGNTAARELGPAGNNRSQSGPDTTRMRSRDEDTSAALIQRNVRGARRRKSFFQVQSAREELVLHLQSVVSAATSLARSLQQPHPQTVVESGTSGVSRVQDICATAERMMATSREEGLARPPFDILRAMYSAMTSIEEELASLTAEVGAGRITDMGEHAHESFAAMAESCRAARRVLRVLTEAVGADTALGELTAPGSSPTAVSPAIPPRGHPNSPAGSGRAAAVAMASARGDPLTSPNSCGRGENEVTDSPGIQKKERIEELVTDRGRAGQDQSPPVPLNTLGVEGIGMLLRLHGFEEHADGFLAQAVDGVMLSDPNLCDADFAELGLGGGGADADDAGAAERRARLVAFFRRCQEQGAIVHHRDTALLSGEAVASPGAAVSGTSDSGLPETTAKGASESGSLERGDASETTNARKEACGEPCAIENTAAGCGGPDGDGVVSDLPPMMWHRGPAQLRPQGQQVIADISEHADEGRAALAAAGGSDRRISVKVNVGVMVTVGGVAADLIDDVDRLSTVDTDDEEDADVADGKSGEATPVVAGALSVNRPGRRTSVGCHRVTLDVDPSRNGDGGTSDAGGERLSPGLAVTSADITLNVFQDGELRP